jgi:hypothetical protein
MRAKSVGRTDGLYTMSYVVLVLVLVQVLSRLKHSGFKYVSIVLLYRTNDLVDYFFFSRPDYLLVSSG